MRNQQKARKGIIDRNYCGNFKWEEFYVTRETDKNGTSLMAINYPTRDEEYDNIHHLCRYYLQPLRDHFQMPIRINSGFRCTMVNNASGGARDSWHLRGCAADVHVPSALVGCQMVAFLHERFEQLGVPYQELLLSKSTKTGSLWLHIAFNPEPLKSAMRCRVMVY